MPPVDVPKNPSPLKAIRRHCLSCGDGTRKMVDECPLRECELHPYRFGVMPATYLAQIAKNKGK